MASTTTALIMELISGFLFLSLLVGVSVEARKFGKAFDEDVVDILSLRDLLLGKRTNFAPVCDAITFSGTVLKAQCPICTGDHTYEPTSLDLNTGISNICGQLQFDHHHKRTFDDGGRMAKRSQFALTCTRIDIADSSWALLTAVCESCSGTSVSTTLDLNTGISNNCGILQFDS